MTKRGAMLCLFLCTIPIASSYSHDKFKILELEANIASSNSHYKSKIIELEANIAALNMLVKTIWGKHFLELDDPVRSAENFKRSVLSNLSNQISTDEFSNQYSSVLENFMEDIVKAVRETHKPDIR